MQTSRLAAGLARRENLSSHNGGPPRGYPAPLNEVLRVSPSSPRPTIGSPRRSALTLVELLVVIVLLLIVTAVAIPVLSPNSESRRIRESARLVSTFLSGARNRAIELGRPVGVQFERLTSNPNAAMVLSYVEVPPPYSGETLDATCTVFYDNSSGTPPYKLLARMPATTFSPNLIQPGDLIKINYQGYTYVIDSLDTSTNTMSLDVIAPNNPPLPWLAADESNSTAVNALPKYPYQIIRQPVKASDTPLQLPEGAVVDLRLSGEGTGWIDENQATVTPVPLNPAIIFGPNGAVLTRFNFQDPTNTSLPHYQTPASALHFLIGRSDGVGVNDSDFPDKTRTPWNLRDLNNLWVSVGSQSGLVSTAENARVSETTFTITGTAGAFSTSIAEARSIARSFQSMGGR